MSCVELKVMTLVLCVGRWRCSQPGLLAVQEGRTRYVVLCDSGKQLSLVVISYLQCSPINMCTTPLLEVCQLPSIIIPALLECSCVF